MLAKTSMGRDRTRKPWVWVFCAVFAIVCGCKTFNSTEEDLARERKLHGEFLNPETSLQDSSNPSLFRRPRN